jgi:uncharacterized membrane protein
MKDRVKAFLIHLSISSIIAILTMILVFQIWYPAPLHDLIGVDHIFYTLISIDIIIGPVLTFVVFNRKKPHLKWDLMVIALFQISALCYGVWTVSQGRPAWIVFSVDRFDLIQAQDIDNRQRNKSASEYKTAPWLGPKWVYAEAPKDIKEYNTLTFESIFAGVDLPQRPDLYKPIDSAHDKIVEHALPLKKLTDFNQKEIVEKDLQRWPQADAYLPLSSKTRAAVVLLKSESAQILGITMLQPW